MTEARDLADDLVRFFLGLPSEVRREYDLLAEADRAFGEDVAAEQRATEERGR